jgi:hypothetical protein
MTRTLLPELLGIMSFIMIVAVLVIASRIWHPSHLTWICDDTPYSDTMPEGRQVVGPAVRPIPGCDGEHRR